MSLGERIYALRIEQAMSQAQLAEALEVSRQSVSKWETDASVPDLDKLVKLSKLFGVTLDELVQGKMTPISEEEPLPETETAGDAQQPKLETSISWRTGRTVPALILFGLGVVLLVVLFLMGGSWLALWASAPFLASGLISVTCRRHPVLWSVWAFHFALGSYLSFASSVDWSLIFYTVGYDPAWNVTRLVMAWVIVVVRVVLVLATVRILGRAGKVPSNRGLLVCGVTAALLLIVPDPLWYLLREWDEAWQMWFLRDGWDYPYRFLSYGVQWLRLFGCSLCAGISIRRLSKRKKNTK